MAGFTVLGIFDWGEVARNIRGDMQKAAADSIGFGVATIVRSGVQRRLGKLDILQGAKP